MIKESMHDDFTDLPIEERRAADWLIKVALLPALLVAVAIGITAAVAPTAATSSWPNRILPNTAGAKAPHGDVDDYVEGLAKRGIATIPGYGRSPDRRLGLRGD